MSAPDTRTRISCDSWRHSHKLGRTGGREHRLVLAGDHGPYGARLAVRAAELDVASRVTFTGPVADAELASLYRQATALAIVSLSEGSA